MTNFQSVPSWQVLEELQIELGKVLAGERVGPLLETIRTQPIPQTRGYYSNMFSLPLGDRSEDVCVHREGIRLANNLTIVDVAMEDR